MGEKGAKGTTEAAALAERVVMEFPDIGEIAAKKMFGGHGLFESDAMFGMVTAKSVLCFKVDDSNRKQFEDAGSERMGKMPYYPVPKAVLEESSLFREWATQSMASAGCKEIVNALLKVWRDRNRDRIAMGPVSGSNARNTMWHFR